MLLQCSNICAKKSKISSCTLSLLTVQEAAGHRFLDDKYKAVRIGSVADAVCAAGIPAATARLGSTVRGSVEILIWSETAFNGYASLNLQNRLSGPGPNVYFTACEAMFCDS